MSLYGDLEETAARPSPTRAESHSESEGLRAVHAIRAEEDLLATRHAVREATLRAGFGLVDQTRIVTAASELARNAYVHGGGAPSPWRSCSRAAAGA